MAHDVSAQLHDDPSAAWITGDARNAYGSPCRAFTYREALATHPVLAAAMRAMYAGPTVYVHRSRSGQPASLYSSTVGGVQGDPIFMDLYCLAQAPSVAWADAALRAVHHGRQLGPWAVEQCHWEGQVAEPPSETWAVLQAWVCKHQHLSSNVSTTLGVASKFYVDDGVRKIDRVFLAGIPELANAAGRPARISYHDGKWEAYSPVALDPLPGITVRTPHEGLIIAGAPAGLSEALALVRGQVVIGGPTVQAAQCLKVQHRTVAAADAVRRAVSGAAGADVAARAGLAVLAKCVAHKAGYIERVFPPDLVGPYITNIRLAIWDAAARILEWSHSERDARQLRLQAAMHHNDGGLDLALHPDPYAFLASWWGAAHARAGAVPPSQIVRAAAGDHSPAGTVVSAAFAACAARDSAIPPSLEGLADRLDTLQEDGRNFARGRNSDQPRFLWQKALSGGARKAAAAEWESLATLADRHRVQSSAGRWVHEGLCRRSGLVTRRTFAIAIRLRFGLKLAPAISTAPEKICGHITVGGVRCPIPLDQFGHHAVACGKGGGFVARHDAIVQELATALRALGLRVRVEKWVDDLVEVRGETTREARMDLVVQSERGVEYIDVTCYHPFTSTGLRRTHASGGTPLAQEERKRGRYPVRSSRGRRRLTMARFIPVAISTYGLVGPAAVKLFSEFERYACKRTEVASHLIGGRLAGLVSEVAVFGAARMALDAFSAPDGQEWAHRAGRIPTTSAPRKASVAS